MISKKENDQEFFRELYNLIDKEYFDPKNARLEFLSYIDVYE